MKAVIQRVTHGFVFVNEDKSGEIEKGYVVFVGFKRGDTEEKVRLLVQKILQMQLFSGRGGLMRKTIVEEGGAILVVPEITLYARVKSGRPDFSEAEKQEYANQLFEFFVKELRKSGVRVETGVFGAHMLVKIDNDGPVTILEEL
jgi:D-tyrosyl-tRNA(Tyr) deacylase